MTADKNFENYIKRTVEAQYPMIDNAKTDPAKYKQIWKFKDIEDFLYGLIIGRVEGAVFVGFEILNKRKATTEEIFEIKDIVESYASDIRETITKKLGNSE